jgi:hypothetical protein
MQVTYERCSGLDVHKKSVTACVITPEGKVTRTYGTICGTEEEAKRRSLARYRKRDLTQGWSGRPPKSRQGA